jgi:hypothetical protein
MQTLGIAVAFVSFAIAFAGFCDWKDDARFMWGDRGFSERYAGHLMVWGLVGTAIGVLIAIFA